MFSAVRSQVRIAGVSRKTFWQISALCPFGASSARLTQDVLKPRSLFRPISQIDSLSCFIRSFNFPVSRDAASPISVGYYHIFDIRLSLVLT
jgi:hypothetical protein